ncbi:MAG: hypothetical protein SGI96_19725 [Bacteroidota bacterium]|nr:hypothetical protein [Bacteroidota bacterium]
MGQLFALAIECNRMPIKQIEMLLESPIHEVSAGSDDAPHFITVLR